MIGLAVNEGLTAVRDRVRANALESLEFYANTVLALRLSEDLCNYTQDVCNDEENALIRTKRARALCVALTGWLGARGVTVLSDTKVETHEIISWLQIEDGPSIDKGCTLHLVPDGLEVTWL